MATSAELQTQLDGWYASLAKIQNGEEARRGDRVLKYADLKEVRETIDWLEAKIKSLSIGDGSGDITPKSIVPIDEI